MNANANYKLRVQNALSRMRARGGACAALANLGDTLVAQNRVCSFHHGTVGPSILWGASGGIGGALPQNGGPTGDYAFITISDRLTRFAWDGEHSDQDTGRNLDRVLAHELSHLLGEYHIPGSEEANDPRTMGEEDCGV